MKDIPVKHLDLSYVVATATSSSTDVDFLIGAYYCWQMVIEEARRLNRSLGAIDATFRWALQALQGPTRQFSGDM